MINAHHSIQLSLTNLTVKLVVTISQPPWGVTVQTKMCEMCWLLIGLRTKDMEFSLEHSQNFNKSTNICHYAQQIVSTYHIHLKSTILCACHMDLEVACGPWFCFEFSRNISLVTPQPQPTIYCDIFTRIMTVAFNSVWIFYVSMSWNTYAIL